MDDPFADLAPSGPAPAPPDADDPFGTLSPDGKIQGPSMAGVLARGAARSLIPMAAGVSAMGAGAEVGAELGAVFGPVGAATGGLIGGMAGAYKGSQLASDAQNWAISKLPDATQEMLGQTPEQQTADLKAHPYAAFIGGMAPYAIAFQPGGFATAALPENATALQQIMANPVTSKLLGGAVNGGLELGQEAVSPEDLDWRKVAVATAFGMFFNKPTRLGELITETGAVPARIGLRALPPMAPTVAQAADSKIVGPGITESVFEGTEKQDPHAAMAVQQTAREEIAAFNPTPPGPDLTSIVRSMEPDLFAKRAELMAKRDQLRTWIDEYLNPPDRHLDAAANELSALQDRLDANLRSNELAALADTEFRKAIQEQLGPYAAQAKGLPEEAASAFRQAIGTGANAEVEARSLRAKIRDAQSRYDELVNRSALAAGKGADDPGFIAARNDLRAAEAELENILPQVTAAYRRAAEHVGQPLPAIDARPAAPAPPAEGKTSAPSPDIQEAVNASRAAIASDAMAKLVAAGRPPEEAALAAQLLAERYVTRAALFEGALGTPEQLYKDSLDFRPQAAPQREPVYIGGKRLSAEHAATVLEALAKQPGGNAPRAKGTKQAPLPQITINGELVTGPQAELLRKKIAGIAKPDVTELEQGKHAKITFSGGGKATIAFMKDADASAVIHEVGHQLLRELVSDAAHPKAPDILKADAQTIMDWLAVRNASAITRAQHEKFARGFEQYLREGIAPSPQLANVFAKFRQWLISIYQTLSGLGAPINQDVRGVFDRMLAQRPDTIIANEPGHAQSLGALHAIDAEMTAPEDAAAAQAQIIAEIGRDDEIQKSGGAAGVRGEHGTVPQEAGRIQEPGRGSEGIAGGAGAGERPGNVVAGGGAIGEEGARVRGEGQRPVGQESQPGQIPDRIPGGKQFAPIPSDTIAAQKSRLIDKAGNIRIENLTASSDIADAIHEAARVNNDFIGDRRGVVTDGMVEDLADDLGMSVHQLSTRKIGEAFNAEQVWAARKLLVQSATDVANKMRIAANGSEADLMAYALAKTRHQMIQGQVAGITAEAGRALRAFRAFSVLSDEEKITNSFLANARATTLFQLRREAQLGAAMDSPQAISQFIQDSQRRSFGRMVLEYWINGLISGPATHTTYMIGNTLLSLEKIGPETFVAAGVGRIARLLGREGEIVRFGETGAQLAAGVRAIPSAIEAATGALRTGVTTLLPMETQRALPFQPGTALVHAAQLNEAATFHDAVGSVFGLMRGLRDGIVSSRALLRAGGAPGAPMIGFGYSPLGYLPNIEFKGAAVLPVGDIFRTPSRFIAAIHSFFRTINYSMEKNAIAYRTAANEGLSGAALQARIADIRQNPSVQIMEAARKEATSLTLMGPGGDFTRALSRLTNVEVGGLPILKFIDPFVHISSNIIEEALLKRTPAGVLSSEIRADLMGKNGNIAQDKAISRMLMGSALALAYGGLAAEGYITGSGPADPKKAAMWRLAGNQAHSIRIGDTFYDMHRLGPLGLHLGVAADMYEVAHLASKKDMLTAAAAFQHGIVQNILDESFMRGPADLIKAVEEPERYGKYYARNMIASFMPFSVGSAQIARAVDPYSRQARTVVDALKQKVPWESETLLPRRDVWGEPVPAYDALIAKGLTAIYERQLSNDPVNQALLKLGIAPAMVQRKIRGVDLTDQEYDDYARIAGQTAKKSLDVFVRQQSFNNLPPYMQHEMITHAISSGREAARNLMMAKYPHIIADAMAKKQTIMEGNAYEPIE